MSEDPIGLAARDVNFYAYVANNPSASSTRSGWTRISVLGEAVRWQLRRTSVQGSATSSRQDSGPAISSGFPAVLKRSESFGWKLPAYPPLVRRMS